MKCKWLCYLSLFLLNTVCYGQKKCEELYHVVFNNNIVKAGNQVVSFGKDAIPCLIDMIDVKKESSVGFQDPNSSSTSLTFRNCAGISAAYLIELILSKDSLLNTAMIDGVRIYQIGVIVKIKKNNPVLEKLNYNDMLVIKKIYTKWWELNKRKTIVQLRDEWRKNKNILGKKFRWV